MSPNIAAEAYKRSKDDRLLKWVFQKSDMTLQEFFEYFTRNDNFPVLVFFHDNFAGYAWLNGLSCKRAFAHFCFFNSVWGSTETIADAVLDYWFAMPDKDGTHLFEVLVGATPEDNRLAVRFNKRMGFNQIGVIPYMEHNKPCVISYKTRSEHNGRKKSKRT